MKAVIFDMSGVIADIIQLHAETREKTLAKYGISCTSEDHEATAGQSLKEQLAYYTDKYGVELPHAKISAEMRAIQAKEHHKIKPCKGVEKLIRSLHGHYKLAVISSNLKVSVNELLDNFKLGQFFDVVIGIDSHRTIGTTQRETYLEAAQMLGVKPTECTLIEDSPESIKVGKELGMKSIAVPNQYNKQREFSADLVVNSLEEVTLETINRL